MVLTNFYFGDVGPPSTLVVATKLVALQCITIRVSNDK